MRVASPRAIDFACHSKACAPPPAGKGGSDKGSKLNPDIDVFPATIKWSKGKTPGVSTFDGDGYTLRRVGYDKLSYAWNVEHGGKKIGQEATIRIAKTRAEMHKAGVAEPFAVRFFNIPD